MKEQNQDEKAKHSKLWKNKKPEMAGIYWVKGFMWHNPRDVALVEVCRYRGNLICNLGNDNTEREKSEWSLLSDLSEKFEWLEVAA